MVNKAKHKDRIPDGLYDYVNKNYLKSIRSQVLQKLVFLLFLIGYSESDLRKELDRRLLEEYRRRVEEYGNAGPMRSTYDNLVAFLKTEDICEILRCQERTAREYRDALLAIAMTMTDLGHI